MGLALAKVLARNHEVIVGSRDPGRAAEAAKAVKGALGADYSGAARGADVVVISIPYSALPEVSGLRDELKGKLVISIVNPIRPGKVLEYGLEKGSAAEELAKLLPESRVATAFNNVPRSFLEKEIAATIDILVAADSRETYEETARLVSGIKGMRPLYAGPLSQAGVVERMTPLVLNLASLNGTGVLATAFVSRKGKAS